MLILTLSAPKTMRLLSGTGREGWEGERRRRGRASGRGNLAPRSLGYKRPRGGKEGWELEEGKEEDTPNV